MDIENFVALNTSVEEKIFDGEKVFRVVKNQKLNEFDIDSIVKLKEFNFHNGIIEVEMLSRLLPDAPDFARGFIGIAFRIAEDNSAFESFYIRPTNAMTDDPVRKAHGCQYFSYPKYTFAYFREKNISDYESPMPYGLDTWVKLTAKVVDDKAEFFLNDNLTLTVENLKGGNNLHGSVGFFLDTGTEAFYKNLKITKTD